MKKTRKKKKKNLGSDHSLRQDIQKLRDTPTPPSPHPRTLSYPPLTPYVTAWGTPSCVSRGLITTPAGIFRVFGPPQLFFEAFWGSRSAVSCVFVDIVGRSVSSGCRVFPVRAVNLPTPLYSHPCRSTCLQSPICYYLVPCSRQHLSSDAYLLLTWPCLPACRPPIILFPACLLREIYYNTCSPPRRRAPTPVLPKADFPSSFQLGIS